MVFRQGFTTVNRFLFNFRRYFYHVCYVLTFKKLHYKSWSCVFIRTNVIVKFYAQCGQWWWENRAIAQVCQQEPWFWNGLRRWNARHETRHCFQQRWRRAFDHKQCAWLLWYQDHKKAKGTHCASSISIQFNLAARVQRISKTLTVTYNNETEQVARYKVVGQVIERE